MLNFQKYNANAAMKNVELNQNTKSFNALSRSRKLTIVNKCMTERISKSNVDNFKRFFLSFC